MLFEQMDLFPPVPHDPAYKNNNISILIITSPKTFTRLRSNIHENVSLFV